MRQARGYCIAVISPRHVVVMAATATAIAAAAATPTVAAAAKATANGTAQYFYDGQLADRLSPVFFWPVRGGLGGRSPPAKLFFFGRYRGSGGVDPPQQTVLGGVPGGPWAPPGERPMDRSAEIRKT